VGGTRLIEARDADFSWMLGGAPSRKGLRLPPGGVDSREAVTIVRSLHDAQGGDGSGASWLMVWDDEVVGLCGRVRLPGDTGEVEIGYSVSPDHRRRGHAGRAVAELVAMARRDASARAVTAVTAADNTPSHGVLRLNGFVETAREVREDDGPVILWRLDLSAPAAPALVDRDG
jgi:RimJ/RimL family protein N-acetyltransferase